jgi:hypothetical protein
LLANPLRDHLPTLLKSMEKYLKVIEMVQEVCHTVVPIMLRTKLLECIQMLLTMLITIHCGKTLSPHDKTSSTLIFSKQATLKFRVFSKSVMKNLEVWSFPRKCSNFGITQDHLKW